MVDSSSAFSSLTFNPQTFHLSISLTRSVSSHLHSFVIWCFNWLLYIFLPISLTVSIHFGTKHENRDKIGRGMNGLHLTPKQRTLVEYNQSISRPTTIELCNDPRLKKFTQDHVRAFNLKHKIDTFNLGISFFDNKNGYMHCV